MFKKVTLIRNLNQLADNLGYGVDKDVFALIGMTLLMVAIFVFSVIGVIVTVMWCYNALGGV